MQTPSATMEQKEEIVMTMNDHWIVFLKPVLLFLIGWGTFFFLSVVAVLLRNDHPQVGTGLLVFAFLMLVTIHHFFFNFLIAWDLSQSLITTRRIVDFRTIPLVQDEVIFINIPEIHEIEKRKRGFLQNVLNYGDVWINVAALPTPFELHYIPHPGKFANFVEAIKFGKLHEAMDLHEYKRIYKQKYRSWMK